MKPVCSRCKDEKGPFLVLREVWVCAVCAYIEEHPNAYLTTPKRIRARKQKEKLFNE